MENFRKYPRNRTLLRAMKQSTDKASIFVGRILEIPSYKELTTEGKLKLNSETRVRIWTKSTTIFINVDRTTEFFFAEFIRFILDLGWMFKKNYIILLDRENNGDNLNEQVSTKHHIIQLAFLTICAWLWAFRGGELYKIDMLLLPNFA